MNLYPTRCASKTEPFVKYFAVMIAGNRAKAISTPKAIAHWFQNSENTYLAVCVLTCYRRSKLASKVHCGDHASDIYSPLSLKSIVEHNCTYPTVFLPSHHNRLNLNICARSSS